MALELIIIHVPRTGGTTVYQHLRRKLGEDGIRYFRRDEIQSLKQEISMGHLSPETRAIQGHFTYQEVAKLHQASGAKIAVVFRDPMQRLISNYAFFKESFNRPPALWRPHHFSNIHRRNERFLRYALRRENRNVITQHLAGADLARFDFVGKTEELGEFLKKICTSLQVGLPSDIGKENQRATPWFPGTWELVACRFLNRRDVRFHRRIERFLR